MLESSVIQHFLQKGIQQGIQLGKQAVQQGIEQGYQKGVRETTIEGIVEYLEVRFNTSDLQNIASELALIEDIEHLKQLRREALQTFSVVAFQQTLAENATATP